MSSRAIGSVALVRPGIEVFSKSRRYTAHGEEFPVGGIVVVEDGTYDPETSEIARRFLVLDRHRTQRLHWAWLVELDIDHETAKSVDTSVLIRLWRRLAYEVAFSAPGRQRRGPATRQEVELAEALLVLVRIVFGPDGLLHAAMEMPTTAKPVEPLPAAPVNVSALVD